MQIRAHTARDYHQLAELRWLLKAEDEPILSDGARDRFAQDYEEQLRSSDALGDTQHWVIDDAPLLAGALTIRIVRKELSPQADTAAWGYLTNMFVRESLRRRGLGSELLKHAIDWAIATDLELLIVWPSECSYSFYRRAGFRGESDPLELLLEDRNCKRNKQASDLS
ncbi:MAG: GNAT family N-acetyltransferase [Pseudomonadota bacterium]